MRPGIRGPLFGGLARWLPALLLACVSTFSATAAEAEAPARSVSLDQYLQSLGYYPLPLKQEEGGHLLLEGMIADKRRKLLVDTGWSITAVDRGIAKRWKTIGELGIVLEDPFLGRITNSECLMVPSLRLGQAHFTNQPASSLRLSFGDLAVSAVLGCDFLYRHHCLIDCAKLKLYVRSQPLEPEQQVSMSASLERSGMKRVRLARAPGLGLTGEGRINGERVKLFVDTGAFWTILDEKHERRCRLDPRPLEGVARGVRGRQATLYSTTFKSMELDGQPIPILTKYLAVASLEPWRIGSKDGYLDVDGLLGMDLLVVCRALVDFGAECLWIVPKRN